MWAEVADVPAMDMMGARVRLLSSVVEHSPCKRAVVSSILTGGSTAESSPHTEGHLPPEGGPLSFPTRLFPARSPLGGQFVTLGSLSPSPAVLDYWCMQVNACRSAVLDAVEALPALERETLALVFYRGMSCDEVAATMKTTVDVVRDRLHEGSRALLAGVGGGL